MDSMRATQLRYLVESQAIHNPLTRVAALQQAQAQRLQAAAHTAAQLLPQEPLRGAPPVRRALLPGRARLHVPGRRFLGINRRACGCTQGCPHSSGVGRQPHGQGKRVEQCCQVGQEDWNGPGDVGAMDAQHLGAARRVGVSKGRALRA